MSINPTQVNINAIFGVVPYFIDFYQREYKWKKEHVISLLDDIFYRFEQDYNLSIDPTESNISKFNWYYLSSFMTNNYDGKIYLVDGQQRLTTITLILIKLYHLSDKYSVSFFSQVLEQKIFGIDISGLTYWMGQNGRAAILEKLFRNDFNNFSTQNITYMNMILNFNEISKYLDFKLDNDHKYKCFVIYLLKNVVLVKIDISDYKDVPMVFEVINDRGEKLRSYEVFKGQLLGQLEKDDVHRTYHPLWSKSIEPLEAVGDVEADNFFKYYFRAKYCDTAYHHRQFEGDYYNRTIFSNDWDIQIGLKHNVNNVREFVSNQLVFYSTLYHKLLNDNIYNKSCGEFVYYNRLNDQDRQYMLILSACEQNDQSENDKIIEISRLLDRHYVLLQLYGCYDSNTFSEILIDINKEIRNKPLNEIKNIFDQHLLKDIETIKGVSNASLFDYTFFKNANTNLGIRFIRYFFARIENFMATEMNVNQKLTKNQLWDLVRNTGVINGYHIEHILANNSENKLMFNNDEELFQRERNRLGALLLLKGRDNISSGNERYADKLLTYNNADISNRWNRSLSATFYYKHKDFDEFIKRRSLPFKYYDIFNEQAVEERQILLFDMVKCIWG
jgi:uncharacterized protein with ParB-like and HNH nuclease domain